MRRCAGTKRDGSQCTVTVNPPQTHCWWHDPANAKARKQAASRGGRAKARSAVKGLHELLEDLTTQVVDGELSSSQGAVAAQLINTRIRLLEYERRLKETGELEERLAQLEQAAAAQGDGEGRRWG